MIHHYETYLSDILAMHFFKNAEVVAGGNNLQRKVTWAHIVETSDFSSFINGYELVLTTGSQIPLDSKTGVKALEILIDKEAACICIELGTHLQKIAPEVIEYANIHDFPIIVFNDFVKFIDITQGLHTLLMNKQNHMLRIINELSRDFNELSLLPNGIIKILEALHRTLGGNIFYRTQTKKNYYYPPEIMAETIEAFETEFPKEGLVEIHHQQYQRFLVKSSGIHWGYLLVESSQKDSSQFMLPILHQAALAIAQIMLRNRTIEERERNTEDKLVRDMILGHYEMNQQLEKAIPVDLNERCCRLVFLQRKTIKHESNDELWYSTQLQQTILLREILKRKGFSSLISVRKNDIIILVFYEQTEHIEFKKTIQQILSTNEDTFNGDDFLIGLSNKYSTVKNIPERYDEAKRVVHLRQEVSDEIPYYYEEIGIYRLLLGQEQQLVYFVTDYLSELIEYDRLKNTELVRTLEVYFDHNLSKKETATKLFIARQSLYHRLDKIEALLGYNISETMHRLPLEVALKARRLISNIQF